MLTAVKLMTSFQTNCFCFVSTLFSPIPYRVTLLKPPSPIPFHISPCIMCVQYHGGYHERDILSTVGDILSTVGGVQYHGGYHEYHGGYLEYHGGIS